MAELGRIQIEVDTDLGSLIKVTRMHPSGRTVAVRGMDFATLSGGQFIGWDYEAPVGLPMVYTASVWADQNTLVATAAPGTVTFDTQSDWLKDPLQPSRNMQVQIMPPASGAFAYATPSGVHPVLGRPDPIVVTTVRQAATGSLAFLTQTEDERDHFHYLTASGNVLLLQSTQESGVGNLYFAPLNVTEDVISTRDDPGRIWTVQYQEVGIPEGTAAAFNTWQDVANLYDTWQELCDANPGNWLDFIANFQSEPKVIVTWRGA